MGMFFVCSTSDTRTKQEQCQVLPRGAAARFPPIRSGICRPYPPTLRQTAALLACRRWRIRQPTSDNAARSTRARKEHHAGSRQGRGTLLRRSAATDAGLFSQRFASARLGHEEPHGARVRPELGPHRDARRRPRLFPGPDHRARAHRPFHRPAIAVLRCAVLHARHFALAHSGGVPEADGAARERRPEHLARGTLRRSRSPWTWTMRCD